MRRTEAEAAGERNVNTAQHREARSRQTEAEAAGERSVNSGQRREARSHQSGAEAAGERSVNTAQRRGTRSHQSEAEAAEERAVNTAQHRRSQAAQRAERLRGTTGIAFHVEHRPVGVHSLGAMNDVCSGCNAEHFVAEKTMPGRNAYQMCCAAGKVSVNAFENFSNTIRNLYTGNDEDSKKFREEIRNYNNSLAMASMVADVQKRIFRGRRAEYGDNIDSLTEQRRRVLHCFI